MANGFQFTKWSKSGRTASASENATSWFFTRILLVILGLSAAVVFLIGVDLSELRSNVALGTWKFKDPIAVLQTKSRGQKEQILEIPLNPNSTLANDLLSIQHNPKQAKLIVNLNGTAQCPRPYLIGRLAGPVLVRVENWTWTAAANSNGTHTMEGHYQVPVGGEYFLEIVALYCDHFFYQLMPSRWDANQSDWLNATNPMQGMLRLDFSKVCMQDIHNHRLTADNATIWVHNSNTNGPNDNTLGYWTYNASRTTWGNREDATYPPTAAPTISPAPTASLPPTTAPPTLASTTSNLRGTTVQTCKFYMSMVDKNADNYMDANKEYIDFLNKMTLPKPRFLEANFTTLPESLQTLYQAYAAQYSKTDEVDIHGVWGGIPPTSPEQGHSLDLLCNDVNVLLDMLPDTSQKPTPAPTQRYAASATISVPISQIQASDTPKPQISDRKRRLVASSNSSTVKPLYTRFQTHPCMLAHQQNLPLPEECREWATVHRFDPYQFEWNQPLSLQDLQQPNQTVVCVMGHSHSRILWHAGQRLGLVPNNPTNVTVEWTDARFPQDITVNMVQNYIHAKNCSKLIIAVGQWPASYVDGRAMGLLEFYYRMRGLVENLVQSSVVQRLDVSLRSIHYNPPSFAIQTCPPQGWRNPLVIDAYNAILVKVGQEYNVPFYDTNFLVGPVWDAAPDWCHLGDHTSEQELLYLAASALGVV